MRALRIFLLTAVLVFGFSAYIFAGETPTEPGKNTPQTPALNSAEQKNAAESAQDTPQVSGTDSAVQKKPTDVGADSPQTPIENSDKQNIAAGTGQNSPQTPEPNTPEQGKAEKPAGDIPFWPPEEQETPAELANNRQQTSGLNSGDPRKPAGPGQNDTQSSELKTGGTDKLKWLEGSVMPGALPFYRELGIGMSGDDVQNLQQRLFDLGYMKTSPHGNFDTETEDGVKAFQKDHGLTVDGLVGEDTLHALNWRHFLDEPVVSPLADTSILTEKCYSREDNPIRFIIPHHMAARNTGAACAEYFTNNSVGTSANYCIGYGGDIAQNVPEQYGAWTSGDVNFDRQAITIEISDTELTDYRIPQAAQDAFVKLCVDIVKRNPSLGGKLIYDPEDEPRVIAAKHGRGSWDAIKGNVLIHCWTTTVGTTCPEWHMKEILPELIDRVNRLLEKENTSATGNTNGK